MRQIRSPLIPSSITGLITTLNPSLFVVETTTFLFSSIFKHGTKNDQPTLNLRQSML